MARKKGRKRKSEGRFRSHSAAPAATLSPKSFWLVTGAVVLFVALLAALAAWSGRPRASTVSAALIQGKAKGSPQAPVTMEVFSDFQCSHCAHFALTTERELEEEYVKAGKLRIEYKHFIVGGPDSARAALAAECAAEQGRFWDYHDLLYERQGVALDVPHLKRYAAELGLDRAAFDACMESRRYLEQVWEESLEGRNLGISGTPSFVIGDQVLQGDLPLSTLREAIEAALSGKLGER